jgi:DNA-binding beta-propeller fold protein YncE
MKGFVLWTAVWLLALAAGLALGQRAYVGNAGNSTVVLLDLQGPRVVGAWPGFQQPWSVAYGDGKVYVAEYVGRPDAPKPAGRVVELNREGKALRTLKGAHYPMGVAFLQGKVYVASSAVDWSGQPRGEPEVLVYAPAGEEPIARKAVPHSRFGYPQTLLATKEALLAATTWGYVVFLDPSTLEVRRAFALPGVLNPIRGLALDGKGNLYLTGNKDGDGRLVRLPLDAVLPVPEPQDLDRFAEVVAKGLPDPWGVALVKGVLYFVTSTDPSGQGPGGLYRLEAGGPRRLLDLPTRYTLGLAVEEGP